MNIQAAPRTTVAPPVSPPRPRAPTPPTDALRGSPAEALAPAAVPDRGMLGVLLAMILGWMEDRRADEPAPSATSSAPEGRRHISVLA